MKKTLAFLFIAISLGSCKPTHEQTIDYSDKIIMLQKGIDAKEIALLESFKEHVPAQIDLTYGDFNSTIDSSLKQLDVIGNFDGKSYFTDAARTLFTIYKVVAAKEYSNLVVLNKIEDANFTEENRISDSAATYNVNSKLDSGLVVFKKIHQQLATEYNFEIEKTKSDN